MGMVTRFLEDIPTGAEAAPPVAAAAVPPAMGDPT